MNLIRPALLCVAPALVFALLPAPAREALFYDRNAVLHGSACQLWTGHWMHFSFSHLAWNALVLTGAGAWLERVQPRALWQFVGCAAPLISLAFLGLAPGMQVYGGLSGLTMGVVVLLALTQIRGDPQARVWGFGLLTLVVLKIGFEATHGAPLFAEFDGVVRTSTLAHVAGALSGLAFFLSRATRPAAVITRPKTAATSR
jgi:rhomboid family GlyGly-CTERM serine protease